MKNNDTKKVTKLSAFREGLCSTPYRSIWMNWNEIR